MMFSKIVMCNKLYLFQFTYRMMKTKWWFANNEAFWFGENLGIIFLQDNASLWSEFNVQLLVLWVKIVPKHISMCYLVANMQKQCGQNLVFDKGGNNHLKLWKISRNTSFSSTILTVNKWKKLNPYLLVSLEEEK